MTTSDKPTILLLRDMDEVLFKGRGCLSADASGFIFLGHWPDVVAEFSSGRLHEHPAAHFQMKRGAEPRAVIPVSAQFIRDEGCLGRLPGINGDVDAITGQRQ